LTRIVHILEAGGLAGCRLGPFESFEPATCRRSGVSAGRGRGTFLRGLLGLVLALSCCLGAAADVFDAVRAGDVEKVKELLKADPKLPSSGRSGKQPKPSE